MNRTRKKSLITTFQETPCYIWKEHPTSKKTPPLIDVAVHPAHPSPPCRSWRWLSTGGPAFRLASLAAPTPKTMHHTPFAPYTRNPTPYTLHPSPNHQHSTPQTLDPRPCTLDPLHPAPYTLHPAPSHQHPTPSTLHLTPHTLHPTPYTLQPTPKTLHPHFAS